MPATDPPAGYLSGDELRPFQTAPDGLCWWCQGPADSREHKIKRTDLRWIQGDDPYVFWGSNDPRLVRINGPGAKPVKFSNVLCRKCNSERSQPFDRAYDCYRDYVHENVDDLRYRTYIDAAEIYGSSWGDGLKNLERYFVKHLGCRIRDAGYLVPADLISLVNGSSERAGLRVAIYKDINYYRRRSAFRHYGMDTRVGYIGSLIARMNRDTRQPESFATELGTGAIGAFLHWNSKEWPIDPLVSDPIVPLAIRDDLGFPEVRVDWPSIQPDRKR